MYGLESDRQISKNGKTVCVKDIDLLYHLADKNLLEYLLNVRQDWDDENKRVYIFESNIYTSDEINEFNFKRKKRKQ